MLNEKDPQPKLRVKSDIKMRTSKEHSQKTKLRGDVLCPTI